jgi:hypothetical protein
VDSERIEALREAVDSGRHDPLELPGAMIQIDTRSAFDLADLAERIASGR